MTTQKTLRQLLDEHITAGHLTYDQADDISVAPRWSFSIQEALYYLAGVIIAVGVVRLFVAVLEDASEVSISSLRIIQQDLIQDDPYVTYYVFDGHKLIGTSSFGRANQLNGIQITYWVRKSYQNLGIGKWLFQEMRDHAFYVWNYDFVEIHTDSANTGSQALALGAGGLEWFRYDYETSAWGSTGEMIVWGIDHPAIKFEKRVNKLIVGQLHRPNYGSLG